MKVLQHTRNKRNLFFKPDRADRNYRYRLLNPTQQSIINDLAYLESRKDQMDSLDYLRGRLP